MADQVKTLPKVMSDLLNLALDDLEKAEKDPRYVIDMGTWHEPDEPILGLSDEPASVGPKPCLVCLAGAVMAFSLNANYTRNLRPYNFEDAGDMLQALDELRMGDVGTAAIMMDITQLATPLWERYDAFNRNITSYHTNAEMFKQEMRQLAADLKAAGL